MTHPMRQVIATDKAPKPIANLSQATVCNGIVYMAGVSSRDPATAKVIGKTIEEQVERTMQNVKAILEASGSSMANVLRVECFLESRDHFPALNAAFLKYFPKDPPARAVLMVPFFGLEGMMFEVIVTAAQDKA
jgi:2-iminobutanoate/2-iminopropanoate deaminase